MSPKAVTTKATKASGESAIATINIPRPRLHKLKVSNFRSIGSLPVEIELDEIVVLVGPNNSGKSSILRAYEVVMKHGSIEGNLTLEDFPNGVINPQQLPTIELETIVFEDTAPGLKWIRQDLQTQEKHVRERWIWADIGAPRRVGWEVATGDWHATEGPWGAPNVAQAYRPKAHRVGAFQKPEELAAQVVELLSKAITERTKELSKKKTAGASGEEPSDYEK